MLVYSTLSASNLANQEADHAGRFRRNAENVTEEKNCSEPAYQEFPSDGFTNEQRSGGAIIIHVLIVSWHFYERRFICLLEFIHVLGSGHHL